MLSDFCNVPVNVEDTLGHRTTRLINKVVFVTEVFVTLLLVMEITRLQDKGIMFLFGLFCFLL